MDGQDACRVGLSQSATLLQLRKPPLPSPSSMSLSSLSLPLPYLPFPPLRSPSPLRSGPLLLGNLGERSKLPQQVPAAFCCIVRLQNASGCSNSGSLVTVSIAMSGKMKANPGSGRIWSKMAAAPVRLNTSNMPKADPGRLMQCSYVITRSIGREHINITTLRCLH